MKSKKPSSFFINYEKFSGLVLPALLEAAFVTNPDRISSFPEATWLGT